MSLRPFLAVLLCACATTSPHTELFRADIAADEGRMLDTLQHVMVARSLDADHPGVAARLPLALQALQTGQLDTEAWLDGRCLAGELRACRDAVAARHAEVGQPAPAATPIPHERALTAPTCDGRAPAECTGHARTLLASPEAGQRAEGLGLLQLSCQDDHGPACTTLGDLLLQGSEGAPDRAQQGAQLHTRACKLGQAASCGTLSTLLMSGHGVQVDPEAAFTVGLTACKASIPSGCATAAQLIRAGLVEAPAEGMGPALARKACDLGHDEGCRMLDNP